VSKHRIGPLCFGYFPNDERCWFPRFGVLNTHAEDAIASFLLAQDGKLEIYVYWLTFEIALRLRTRPAQGIRGYVKGNEDDH
jgi:hypothetical protein